jgi:hypothetical protein
MEIRKFRSQYNLELIPASHEGIFLGDLVWDPIIGPPDFSKKGMPNTIYNAFLDAGLITQLDWDQFIIEYQGAPLIDAQLATRTVDINLESVSELQHPKMGRISSGFTSDLVRKFTFSKLQMREMSDLTRIKIDGFLEQMKATRWSEYDGSIRRVFMITELYYGTMRMVVEKQYRAELEAILDKIELEAIHKTEGSHAVEYEFSHDNVPFAMRIERVRSFNG